MRAESYLESLQAVRDSEPRHKCSDGDHHRNGHNGHGLLQMAQRLFPPQGVAGDRKTPAKPTGFWPTT